MTGANMLLLFGGGLLLIAILGGGFEIHELKIPKVERGPRILSAMVGVFFLILGLGASAQEPADRPPSDQPIRLTSHRINFIIFDELEAEHIARGQSEQARIRIDGYMVGALTVNKEFPRSEFAVSVENAGQHSFVIEATAVFLDGDRLTKTDCYGTGMIDVTEGARFIFEARYGANGPCLGWLEKK